MIANDIGDLVEPILAALGESTGSITFTADEDTTNRVAPPGYAGRVIDVPLFSVDQLISEGRTVPAFWKVDVEGYEEAVLAGASQTLANSKVEIVLLEADGEGIEGTMKGFGFQRAVYDPFSRSLSTNEEVPPGNNLWIRNVREVEKRCHESRSFRVLGTEI